ncbi:CAP domain-containing protein [Nocardioides sp.]|uniref:CAP domain-containing protein n=1 Tax=Nocardioides sp. TaxID=35761 RepID=UPI003D0F95EB
MTRVISGLVGILAAGMVTATLSAIPASASRPPLARSAATYAQAAFDATNAARGRHDRRALKKGACLQRYAVRQATRQARQDRMFHQDLGAIQRACNMGWVGENVAVGYPSGRSLVNQGWMRSSGHRANILNRHFTLMGLAARQSADGRWYAAQVFGRRM